MVGVADAGKRDCDVELVGVFVALRLTVGDTRVVDPVGVGVDDDVVVPDALDAATLGEREAVDDDVDVDVDVGDGVGVAVDVGIMALPHVPLGHRVQ